MYKMIIVDDEPSTRSGLMECIDWEQYGIRIVGEADDGDQALELCLRLNPDIVITDVKMPNMDGIELVRRLAEHGHSLKIIFISGYDDVEYLKSALKIDAVDYILKPINLHELENVIAKVVQTADMEKTRRQRMIEMDKKLRQSIPLLRDRFWIRLLKDEAPTSEELIKQMEFLEIGLPVQAEFCTLIISFDDQSSLFSDTKERDIELTSFAVQNICQEIIDERLKGYVFEYSRGEFVAVLALQSETEQEMMYSLIKDMKERLCGFLNRYLDFSLTIGVGESVAGLEELNYSYTTARDAVHQKLFLGKNRIITMDQLESGKDPDHRYVSVLVERLAAILKTADEEKVSGYLGEIFSYLSGNRTVLLKYCQMVGLEILILSTRLLMDLNLFDDVWEKREGELRGDLFRYETLCDMQRGMDHYLRAACRLIREMKSKKSSSLIDMVKQIIADRYATNLTIKEIAQEVYLTSTYVCLLFKQETGETINEYLTRVRISKAKELLKSPDHKLYDISAAIGYNEPGYFSKQFKKYTGLSPSEYRGTI